MKQLRTYEIRLREEFKNLQKLQRRKEIQSVINIMYKDRRTGKKQSIHALPTNMNMYPEEFFITYTMPVFTARNNLKKDWKGVLWVKMTMDALLNGSNVPTSSCELRCDGRHPFNHHVSSGYFCIGGIWRTSIGFGVWYFLLAVGALLNQEEAWLTDDSSGHLNLDAYNYWKERGKEKINDIKWSFNLLSEAEEEKKNAKQQVKITKFKIGKKPVIPRKTFTIKK
jgi:hypothetical protein